MIATVFDGWAARPSGVSIALFAAGWSAGWFLLWRPRHLPRAGADADRRGVAVIVPARDEAHIVGPLIEALVAQARRHDEIVLVDDHSSDDTAAVAHAGGARVLPARPLPGGWAGKPHACHVGALATTADVLVFVDADVTPSATLLDDVSSVLELFPDAVVSVQPWHRPGCAVEHLSMMFNVVALMGSGAFTPLGARGAGRVAFGPVLACTRARYLDIGGHAAADVRNTILEDVALARRFDRRHLFVGSTDDTTFRMYPAGLRSLVEGWTKGIAIGAGAAPWWTTVGAVAWVTSVAGGWLVSPWFALATVLQLSVLARRAGRFAVWMIVLYPVATALFVIVTVRSLVLRRAGRQVSWRGRRLRPDQQTG